MKKDILYLTLCFVVFSAFAWTIIIFATEKDEKPSKVYLEPTTSFIETQSVTPLNQDQLNNKTMQDFLNWSEALVTRINGIKGFFDEMNGQVSYLKNKGFLDGLNNQIDVVEEELEFFPYLSSSVQEERLKELYLLLEDFQQSVTDWIKTLNGLVEKSLLQFDEAYLTKQLQKAESELRQVQEKAEQLLTKF